MIYHGLTLFQNYLKDSMVTRRILLHSYITPVLKKIALISHGTYWPAIFTKKEIRNTPTREFEFPTAIPLLSSHIDRMRECNII